MPALDPALREAHEKYRGELTAAREKAFEQFDSAVLTLSSGGLGVSLAFLDNVVELAKATNRWALLLSWILFTLAILCTLLSFLASQAAIDRQIEIADAYFANASDEILDRPNRFLTMTRWLNRSSALCFVLAVVLTVVFVAVNILQRGPS